jgi:hypothetical protein
MENTEHHHTVGTVPKYNTKIMETEAKSIHIHTWPLTFLGWYRHFNTKWRR